MSVCWATVAFELRGEELQRRALALSKLRAREWRKQQLERGEDVSASQVREMRRDLAQCALGELWEAFTRLRNSPFTSLQQALDELDNLRLSFRPNWGQPERERPVSPYVPPEAFRHFSPLQSKLLAMAAAQLPLSTQLRVLGRTVGGRQIRTLEREQLDAISAAVVVADLVSR